MRYFSKAVFAAATLLSIVSTATPSHAVDVEAAAKTFHNPDVPGPRRLSPLRGWEGHDSSVTEVSNERIVTGSRWREVWLRHAPGTEPPPVDFEKEMVVAMFGGGVSSSVSRISLYDITESDDGIELTTMRMFYDVLANDSFNRFLLVVLPKSTKRLSIVARSYALMRAPQLQYRTVREIGYLQ